MQNKECVIFVYSCYKNRQMWDILSFFFKKNWKDCPYKVCLLTDKYDGFLSDFFDEVAVCDSNWMDMMHTGIEKMNNPEYFILFMDDYFITSKVDNKQIEKYIHLTKEYDCMNIRLSKSSFTEKKKIEGRNDIVDIVPGSAYSISLQPGIWNTEYFLEFSDSDWTPWDFERKGSLNGKVKHTIKESLGWYLPYLEAVRNGKWMPNGYNFCIENGFCDISFKEKMGFKDSLIMEIKALILNLAPKLVLKIQNRVSE